MSRSCIPSILVMASFFAGCAGGSMPPVVPFGQQAVSNPAQPSGHLKRATPPASAIKKIRALISSSSPTWQLLEPLDISATDTFSVAHNWKTCSRIDPRFGTWYVAHASFKLPLKAVSLPPCSTATYNNLYVVELSVVGSNASVTRIAGPALSKASASYFQPMGRSLRFRKRGFYSFFVASYNIPMFAQPDAVCQTSAVTCSLGANPTPGNKLVVVVSDGYSRHIPGVVVKDSAGNALRLETTSECNHCVAVFDETVPPGLTGTVSYTTTGGAVFFPYESAVYELANVGAGRFASVNSASASSSLAATIYRVTNNDIQLCAYIQSGTSASNLTLAYSNGTSETYDFESTVAVFAHEIATANASSTCTANNVDAATEAGMEYADYP